ncbi:MAG: apolipoprotein N-acyltransferase [bacterium]|nr:apolipoprotein N-acyltransferase [bacterium]
MLSIVIGIAAAVVSAALLILAMPETIIWPLAFVAFIPLLFYRVRFNARYGWVATWVFSLGISVYFGHWYFTLMGSGFGGVILASLCIIGFALLYFLIFELAVWVSWRRPTLMPFALPVLWTAFDFVRTVVPGFNQAWFPVITNTQAGNLGLLQNLSVGGVELVTFLILVVNAAIAYVLVKPLKLNRYVWAALVLAGPLFLSVAGTITVNRLNELSDTGNTPKVVLVQGWPDRGQEPGDFIRDNLDKYGKSDSVVVFPEIFLGDFSDSAFRESCRDAAVDFGVYLVIQGPETISGSSYNTAELINPDGETLLKYQKQYIPPGDLTLPGRGLILREGLDDAGLLICYDTHFAPAIREQSRDGVRFFLVPSNDVGYGDAFFYRVHFNNHIFRAVENRAYVYIAGADGITGAISPTGRVIGELPVGVRGEALLVDEQPLIGGITFYARYPWIFPAALIGGLLFVLVAGTTSHRSRWRVSKTERETEPEKDDVSEEGEKVIEAVGPDDTIGGGNGSKKAR